MPTEVELLRVERSEQAKARSECDDGISFEISVAFELMLHSVGKPPRLVTRSRGGLRLAIFPRSSLEKISTGACRLLKDDRLTVYLMCFSKKALTNPLARVIIKVSHKLNNLE